MINFGSVPAGVTLPIIFDTFAGSTGAPITLTGLATSDVKVYKGTSMTERSSANGIALIDTDGIDLDSRTGIHGFSIDLSDNTDSGFYAVGSYYTVIVDTVTIDSQAMRFVAATFRIVAAEAVAGTPKVDVDAWLGTAAATPATAGVPSVDVTKIENGDPSDTIRDAVVSDATRFAGADIAAIKGYIDTEVAAILAAVDTEIAAIKAKTDQLTFTVANLLDSNVQKIGGADPAIPTAEENAEAVMRRDASDDEDDAPLLSLNSLILKGVSRLEFDDANDELTVYKSDGTTAKYKQATTQGSISPIIEVGVAEAP